MAAPTLEERVATLERDFADLRESWDQLGRDFELIEANIKRGSKAKQPPEQIAVLEESFTTLRFEPMKGDKLGDYEIAFKSGNIEGKFQSAYNVLAASNATIKDRYHGAGYAFSYWLFGEGKIYRQRLKQETPK
jgi:hypothetical protein